MYEVTIFLYFGCWTEYSESHRWTHELLVFIDSMFFVILVKLLWMIFFLSSSRVWWIKKALPAELMEGKRCLLCRPWWCRESGWSSDNLWFLYTTGPRSPGYKTFLLRERRIIKKDVDCISWKRSSFIGKLTWTCTWVYQVSLLNVISFPSTLWQILIHLPLRREKQELHGTPCWFFTD